MIYPFKKSNMITSKEMFIEQREFESNQTENMQPETQPTNELITLVETSGLEKSKQNIIAETLGTFFNKAAEWDDTIKSIVITRPDETGKMKMAREGRLTLKNMRLESEKIVKAKRELVKERMANDVLEDKLWLRAGQMIVATFNNLETKLEEKEKFAERWEADRKEKLKAERVAELQPYAEFVALDFIDLGAMDEPAYLKLLEGAKLQQQAKIEAEQKARDEAAARAKAEAEERERIRLENERLKAEAIAKEKELQQQRAKAEADRKAAEEKARKEREAIEAKLKDERLAKEKAEAEFMAKELAYEKAAKEKADKEAAELKAKQQAEKKAAAAPDKHKLIHLATFIDTFQRPLIKSEEGNKILTATNELLAKVSAFIRSKTNEL
jgi:hypothetical protein